MDEKSAELKRHRKDGQSIKTMTETVGYREILAPKLRLRKESLLVKFANANDLKEMITCQQAINAIDNVFVFIDSTIELGRQASEELDNQKEMTRQSLIKS